MSDDRLMFITRRRAAALRARRPVTEAHEKPEHPMSVPLAIPAELLFTPPQLRPSHPLPYQQAIAKARWIAESDPRIAVAVAKRDVLVSAFVSAPHARSGGWTLGVRYMTSSRGGLELLVSAVVDLFAGEVLSLATFEPIAGAGGW
jgi:hypothetical protein